MSAAIDPAAVAGEVFRNRSTGCVIIDLDAAASAWAGNREEEDGNQWMVVCPHGGLASSADFSMARWVAAHPREFCEFHR